MRYRVFSIAISVAIWQSMAHRLWQEIKFKADNFAMHARDRRMRENNDEKVKIRNLDLFSTPIYLLRAAYRCAFKPLNFYEKARTFALAM